MSKYQDTIIAVLLIGFACFFAYETSQIAGQNFQRAPGMVYYPLLLIVSLAATSLLLLVKSLVRPRGATEVKSEEELSRGSKEEELGRATSEEGVEPETASEGATEQEPAAHTISARVLPVLLGVAILATYIFVLAIFGFIISTPVMLVALLLAYGVRDWKVITSLSIGTTAVIYLIFYYLLALQLP